VYGEEKDFACFTWNIAGSECLVMPYLIPVKADQRHELLGNGTISNALTKFAKSGHTHSDIKWRHFGWFEDELLLYDLGGIKSSTEAEISIWYTASIALLTESAGPEKQPATPKKGPTEKTQQSTQQKWSDGSGTKRTRTWSEHRG
jgi:hypothetical protein